MTSRQVLIELLNKKGLSQTYIAQQLGKTRAAVSALLTKQDRREINITSLCSILDTLGYKLVIMPEDKKIEGESYKIG